MSRTCRTCQHLKRPEIDRRLAAGEPATQIARDYELNPSSLHRHRLNCLKLGSSNQIKKEAAQGSAAVALLPSKENLSGAYSDLVQRIDQIVAEAQREGSLKVALSGLNSIRQTLDSVMRLAGHDRAGSASSNVTAQANDRVDTGEIVERLIRQFDYEPETKARIAQALLVMDQQAAAGPQATTTGLAVGIASDATATAAATQPDRATGQLEAAATEYIPPPERQARPAGQANNIAADAAAAAHPVHTAAEIVSAATRPMPPAGHQAAPARPAQQANQQGEQS